MNIAVIIPAAGASRRFGGGGGRSKLDEDLGGRPVLHRTVELFDKRSDVGCIVVAGPADDEAAAAFRLRHGDKLGLLGVRLCTGGRSHRWETVRNALDVIGPEYTHIAVHDAARPCTPPELIDRLFEAAADHAAVIPGLDVSDTIKRVTASGASIVKEDPIDAILGGGPKVAARSVTETLDRSGLVAVQTPQVFAAGLLRRAYAQNDLNSTDDAQLVERLGENVLVVPGDVRNIKITRPSDLSVARSIMGLRGPSEREAHKRF